MGGKVALVAIIALGILGAMSVFTVDERERALKLRLGKVERADYEPGIHFKIPFFVEQVKKFDARIQNLDTSPQRFLTLEKKNVMVDSFIKWRINDVETYYTSTGGNAVLAGDRLSVVIQKGLKDEFGKRTIQQVVSGERSEIMSKLTVAAKVQADELGIEVIDVRIKRIDLPEQVSQSVFERMAAERKEVAQRFRSEGEEQSRFIRAEADREREVILAEAERDAQRIRGEGDSRATDIFAQAFGRDPEFYGLYRSLDAYRNTFDSDANVILLEPNNQFFRFFNEARGAAPGGK